MHHDRPVFAEALKHTTEACLFKVVIPALTIILWLLNLTYLQYSMKIIYENFPVAVSCSVIKLACNPGWFNWISDYACLVTLEQKGFKRRKLEFNFQPGSE